MSDGTESRKDKLLSTVERLRLAGGGQQANSAPSPAKPESVFLRRLRGEITLQEYRVEVKVEQQEREEREVRKRQALPFAERNKEARAALRWFFEEFSQIQRAVNRYKSEKSNAGRSPKRRKGIEAAVFARVSANPHMTNREVWESFPESIDDAEEHSRADDGTEYLVYRDTPLGSFSPRSQVVQVNDRTGKASAITYRRFEAYMTKARNKLKKTPRTSTQ